MRALWQPAGRPGQPGGSEAATGAGMVLTGFQSSNELWEKGLAVPG